MPELPEVETVREGLERLVVGRTVENVQVLHPRAVRRDPAGPLGFAAAMAGRDFKRAERRGKYLWLTLDDAPAGLCQREGDAMLAHLGMSGQMLVGEPDRPLSPHVRARFTFTDGGPDLRFTDQRTFGHLMLCSLGGQSCPGGQVPRGAKPPQTPQSGGCPPPDTPRAPRRGGRPACLQARARADRAYRAGPARGGV